MANKFEGVWTALVTPFKKGELDLKSLRALVKHQLDNGIEGFVVSGTTGESPTLSRDEKKKLLKFVTSEVDGQVPVMFGSGSNSTEDTIELSKAAIKWGAKSLLVVVPYYNKPPQQGLIEHFTAVARASKVPMFLYNVPGRTVAGLTVDSILKLSKIKNIVGIKEATGDLAFGKSISVSCGKKFLLFSGDDGTCVDLAHEGSQGVISVLSHVIPGPLVKLHGRARGGDAVAKTEFKKYLPLTNLLFKEANPIPVKFALKKMGIIHSDELRLPLVKVSSSLGDEIKTEMKNLGI